MDIFKKEDKHKLKQSEAELKARGEKFSWVDLASMDYNNMVNPIKREVNQLEADIRELLKDVKTIRDSNGNDSSLVELVGKLRNKLEQKQKELLNVSSRMKVDPTLLSLASELDSINNHNAIVTLYGNLGAKFNEVMTIIRMIEIEAGNKMYIPAPIDMVKLTMLQSIIPNMNIGLSMLHTKDRNELENKFWERKKEVDKHKEETELINDKYKI